MKSESYQYAPVPGTASPTSNDTASLDDESTSPARSRRGDRMWMFLLVASILASNIMTAMVYSTVLRPVSKQDSAGGRAVPVQHVDHPERAIIEELPSVWRKQTWWSDWGMPDIEVNRSNPNAFIHAVAANEKWDGIRTDHGMIAVDRDWAEEQNWPESMYLPKDPNGKNKAVYLLEGYHQLHCLRMIRSAFFELANGKKLAELNHDVAHTSHCFGTILQHIQCHADSTPLYTFGDRTAGDGQMRQCKSWDALRDYATEHTACYKDGPFDMKLGDHFGYCEEGVPYQDGLDGMP